MQITAPTTTGNTTWNWPTITQSAQGKVDNPRVVTYCQGDSTLMFIALEHGFRVLAFGVNRACVLDLVIENSHLEELIGDLRDILKLKELA